MARIKKYAPKSDIERKSFETKFCDRCEHEHGCDIRIAASMHHISDIRYPKAWRFFRGRPKCMGFEVYSKYKNLKQTSLFDKCEMITITTPPIKRRKEGRVVHV